MRAREREGERETSVSRKTLTVNHWYLGTERQTDKLTDRELTKRTEGERPRESESEREREREK